MNILMAYQEDAEQTSRTAGMLQESGHEPHPMSVEQLFEIGPSEAEADLIIVFAATYREKETRALCRRVRESEAFCETPLLVAVNMYQMPLANRIKEMPKSYFIFTPVEQGDLAERLRMVTEELQAEGREEEAQGNGPDAP
jgi:hypothetical protein